MMNSCSRKPRFSKGVEIDRLSDLPDSILVRILSLLPARDAVRTCLLRTFNDLWREIDTLDFDDDPFQDEECTFKASELRFMRFVNYFLLLRNGSEIHEFRLRFSFPLGKDILGVAEYDEEFNRLQNDVQMHIKVVLSRGVRVLDFKYAVCEFECAEDESKWNSFKFPRFAWISKTLVELSLFNCEIELPDELVRMDSLKVLKLDKVKLSKDTLGRITSGCHLLQDLSINDCIGLGELSLSAPNVEILHVGMEEDVTLGPIIVNCPSLRCFHFSGCVKHVLLMDVSSLKTASLCLKEFPEAITGMYEFKTLLEKMHHAEVMRLHDEASAMLPYFAVKHYPFPCNNWKCVQLDTWLNDQYISGIRNLLRYSSHLKELIIEIKYPSAVSTKNIESEVDLKYVGEDNKSSEWLIHDLKKVTMRGLLKSSLIAQIDLMNLILKNAHVLDEFLIFPEGNVKPFMENALTSDELFKISKELLCFPRASKHAKVFFK